MKMNATFLPALALLDGTGESDLWNVNISGPGLYLHLRRNLAANGTGLEIIFASIQSLFITDEGDVTRFLRHPTPAGVHQITQGGLLWQEHQTPGLLVVTAALPDITEWFIASSGQCAIVLSSSAPTVAKLG